MNRSFLNKAMLNISIALSMLACDKAPHNNPATMNFSIDHYAINVIDLNRSVAFYQNVFDLKEIKNGTELDHIRWFRLGAAEELHIIEVKDVDKKLPKGVHLALRTADFDRFRERLQKANIPYSDWPGAPDAVSTRPDGVRQLYIQDPDGYWVEINDALAD